MDIVKGLETTGSAIVEFYKLSQKDLKRHMLPESGPSSRFWCISVMRRV
ncbi:MAG: hypothetical protein WD038_12010 [Balneolales bacterium]